MSDQPAEIVVIETYRDGGTWTHVYRDKDLARRSMKAMQSAHPTRSYELLN